MKFGKGNDIKLVQKDGYFFVFSQELFDGVLLFEPPV